MIQLGIIMPPIIIMIIMKRGAWGGMRAINTLGRLDPAALTGNAKTVYTR